MSAADQIAAIAGSCGGAMPLPPRGDEQVFAAPWQAQAFAMTVALHERGLFSWPQWAALLGRHVATGAADGSDYYQCWAAALRDLLGDLGIADGAEIEATTQRWHEAAARTPHGHPINLEVR